MKIGILGGGFDPPHLGHLKAGTEAIDKLKLDEVWLVPYNIRNINQKSNIKNQKPRLEMTKLAIRGDKRFKAKDLEIRRGGITYTIDTVLELKKKYPQHAFYWLVGEDLKNELPEWKDYERLVNEIKFVFVKNKTDKKGRKISSREIRERVGNGLSIRGMVKEEVEDYIVKKKLYK